MAGEQYPQGAGRTILAAVLSSDREHIQRDQPPGVPPLALTGERTLPDVPMENYWFRRHVAVYEWIAARSSALEVSDLACGEGYGSKILAARAKHVTGVEANPETYEHARLKYARPGLGFVRELVEAYDNPCDVAVFLQTIEHVRDPAPVLRHIKATLRAGGTAYVSTPNVLTLAPPGAKRSGNPWHVREYRPEEFYDLCASVFSDVSLWGLFHASKLRVHDLALRFGWDRVHRRLGVTNAFYNRFTPAIKAGDFTLVEGSPQRLRKALDLVAVLR